jgi:hypothetical protein
MLLGEALMSVGGPGSQADLTMMRIQRGEQVLWEGERLQAMVAEGRTLDEYGLRAGDRIILPPGSIGGSSTLQQLWSSMLIFLPSYLLGRVF